MALLEPDHIKDQFDTAHTAMRPLWDNFDEYERIARNRPHPKVVSAKLPTVTDGTLAGIISKTPKRVIQQTPTGRVKSIDMPELAKVADFIWTDYILANAKYNGSPLMKSWIMLKKALTNGCAVSYAFFGQRGEYYGVDFSIPYIRDVIFEAGKTYGPDCDILYLRQWYTPAQIQLIIDRQEKLKGSAKARNEDFESSWNIDYLKQLKEAARAKDADASTPQEREKGLHTKFIEIIHCFQTGIGAEFYSFAPDLEDFSMTGNPIVRTQTNPDPRGKMPLSFLYADSDLSAALGIGVPEMSGGMQNLLDSEVQSYQLMMKLLLNPPVKKWGADIKKSSIKWKPNAVWDMGASKTTSDIEAVDISTVAIANFPQNYGLIKSQIMNTAPQDSNTIAANAGNTQSKTHAGVEQNKENLGFDDNYLRKQYEEWWEANSETMLNIHFAVSDGKREIELTEEFIKDTLPGIPEQKHVTFDPIKQKATVMYGAIKTKLKFTVDPTSSESPNDEDQVTRLQEVISEAGSAPYMYYYLLNAGYKLNLGEAYVQLFRRLGVQNIDKIVQELPKDANLEHELRGVMNPLYDKPKVDVKYEDLPPAGQVQAAANAGITLTIEDVMLGPVFDQNMRGVDKNVGLQSNPLMPSGDQQQPTATSGILGPDGNPISSQPTDQVPVSQPGAPLGAAAPVVAPPAPAAPQPPTPGAPAPATPGFAGMSPHDKQLLIEFLKAGYSAKQSIAALALAKQGHPTEDIVKALGQPQGLSTQPKAGAAK